MKKRMISLLLILSFLMPLIPAIRAEEPAAEVKSIEAQIKAFAASHNQSDAASTAAMALAMHGITGGGKTLNFDESSAIAALLLNSEQFQNWLVRGCTGAIRNMQQLDLEYLPYMRGWSTWDPGDRPSALYTFQDPYHDNRDWTVFGGQYSGEWNDNDRALEWIAGITAEYMQITRTQVLDDRAVYQFECTIKDTFDFSTASNSGFKEFLSAIGMLMFQEFSWNCIMRFTLEVPYSCPHGPRAYRWTYDPEALTMTSDGTGGYTENNAEHRTSSTVHYFALEEPVRLLHDQPWVLEYDAKNPGRIPLTPLEINFNSSMLSYLQNTGRSIFLRAKSYDPADNVNGAVESETVYGNSKILLSSISPDFRKTLLTYRLENQVNPDGSNMLFLTVTDPATGEVWADRVPLDDYYESRGSTDDPVLLDEQSDWISGRDLYINYIGNKYYSFDASHFELRIWENGIDGETEDYYELTKSSPANCTEAAYTEFACAACGHSFREYGEPALGHRYEAEISEPTCTEGGFTTYTCICGDSYIADTTDALGHDLTEWTATKEPTCLLPGTEERWCQQCGLRESRTADPLGHDYESVVVEPGCIVGGYTVHTCARCEISYRSDFTSPRGHSYEAEITPPTCTEGGFTTYTCECGSSYRSDFTSPRGHSYEAAITEPTCTGQGFTTYVCACGDSYISNYTNPLGHSMGQWRTVEAPTCTEDGSESRSCVRCDYAENRITDATGHSYTAAITAPTCTEQGFTTYTCECGDSYAAEYVDALGHDYLDGVCVRCAEEDPDYEKPLVNPFTDVPAGAWYEASVLWALENSITSGATDTTFDPNGACLRAQVVTFLWRAAGQPEPTSAENPFVDVKETDFYHKAVLWAVENGITNGADATHFNPFGICNRAQVVTFLHRAYI